MTTSLSSRLSRMPTISLTHWVRGFTRDVIKPMS
uniref:Uncharacterized protein n=1 Tax=Populus trichocarpa TaxID=3694 RepID=A0A3N7FDA6_POPTR